MIYHAISDHVISISYVSEDFMDPTSVENGHLSAPQSAECGAEQALSRVMLASSFSGAKFSAGID